MTLPCCTNDIMESFMIITSFYFEAWTFSIRMLPFLRNSFNTTPSPFFSIHPCSVAQPLTYPLFSSSCSVFLFGLLSERLAVMCRVCKWLSVCPSFLLALTHRHRRRLERPSMAAMASDAAKRCSCASVLASVRVD